MSAPASTYRLQIRSTFGLDAAAGVADYLGALGVGWAYLSPLLQATPGSDHGYDVVDPSRVDPERGGAEGLTHFSDAARAAGLGVLVDIVPNHMGISQPDENPWWWDVLTHGPQSRYSSSFDIDWEFGRGKVRVPILGAPLLEVVDAGDIAIDREAGLVRYFEHTLPLAPGSADGTDDVAAVLDRQHWQLLPWREEATELNYRRFFAVTTLAALRVEVPAVFDAAHAEVLRWVREGLVDGLRIDHPDGLADPGGYLDRLDAALRQALASRTDAGGEPYVLVEKILEHSATDDPETLPAWWRTAGTTGYNAMAEIDRVLIDPEGEAGLSAIDARLRHDTGLAEYAGWTEMIHDTKRMIADTIQVSEIRRLVRLLDAPIPEAEDALAELLACYPVYRSYLPAGGEWFAQALAEASARRPDLIGSLDALAGILTDPSREISRRFQQTTGPVMAKGVEDTAFYRMSRLGTLTEVGGDPSVFALSVEGLHRAFARRQAQWPHEMTSLSTHDTKRGEDVRARLSVLAEMPEEWDAALTRLRGIATTGHGPFDNLLWQAIVGSWPATPERLHAYAEKAAREAAEVTGWWDQDEAFEARMHGVVDAAFSDARAIVDDVVARISGHGWSNSLSAKTLQLMGPGVPDVYQGSELWETSLVDPDNRRAVDFAHRADLLTSLDAAFPADLPPIDATGAAKMLLVSRVLRLRRDRPELFTRYLPMTLVGHAADHAVAFDRGGAIAVATRLPVTLAQRGGWGDTQLLVPSGEWHDELTGRAFRGGSVSIAELLQTYPVAVLRR